MTEKGLLERAKKLGIDVADTEKILAALEGARQHLSNVSDELRMQTTVIKERLTWLIRELDKLHAQIEALRPTGESP